MARTGEMIEAIDGPLDGSLHEKEICDNCGLGEVMDLYFEMPEDPPFIAHRYAYHDCDNTFKYCGTVDTFEEFGEQGIG